jgi:Na+-driven multidrug efflux pump
MCEPAGMLARVLDQLRLGFPYIVALGLPLAGFVLAGAKFSEGDRDDAARLVGASLLGCALYALLLTG